MDLLNLGDIGRRTHIRPKENLAKDEYGMEDVDDFFKETTAIYDSDIESEDRSTLSIKRLPAAPRKSLGAKRRNNVPRQIPLLLSTLSMIPLESSSRLIIETESSSSRKSETNLFQWSEATEASADELIHKSFEALDASMNEPRLLLDLGSPAEQTKDTESNTEAPPNIGLKSSSEPESIKATYSPDELDSPASLSQEPESNDTKRVAEMNFDSGPSHFMDDDDQPLDEDVDDPDPELPGSPIPVTLDHSSLFVPERDTRPSSNDLDVYGIQTPEADMSMDSPDQVSPGQDSHVRSSEIPPSNYDSNTDFTNTQEAMSSDDSFGDERYVNDEALSLLPSTQESRKKTSRRRSEPQKEIRIHPTPPTPPSEDRGVRRSNRKRIHPLAYWRNERVIYSTTNDEEIDPDSTLVMDVNNIPLQEIREIIKIPETLQYKSRQKRKKTDLKNAKGALERRVSSLDELFVEPNPNEKGTEWYKDKILEIDVFNSPDSHVRAKIAYSPQGIDFKEFKTKDQGIEQICKLGAIFDSPDDVMAAAYLDLPVEGVKGRMMSEKSIYYFNVITGHVEVDLNEDKFVVLSGTTFRVPPRNSYSLRNVGEDPARLFVVQCDVED